MDTLIWPDQGPSCSTNWGFRAVPRALIHAVEVWSGLLEVRGSDGHSLEFDADIGAH
jgi:hypothetical protein